jgi:hypothetical protein
MNRRRQTTEKLTGALTLLAITASLAACSSGAADEAWLSHQRSGRVALSKGDFSNAESEFKNSIEVLDGLKDHALEKAVTLGLLGLHLKGRSESKIARHHLWYRTKFEFITELRSARQASLDGFSNSAGKLGSIESERCPHGSFRTILKFDDVTFVFFSRQWNANCLEKFDNLFFAQSHRACTDLRIVDNRSAIPHCAGTGYLNEPA